MELFDGGGRGHRRCRQGFRALATAPGRLEQGFGALLQLHRRMPDLGDHAGETGSHRFDRAQHDGDFVLSVGTDALAQVTRGDHGDAGLRRLDVAQELARHQNGEQHGGEHDQDADCDEIAQAVAVTLLGEIVAVLAQAVFERRQIIQRLAEDDELLVRRSHQDRGIGGIRSHVDDFDGRFCVVFEERGELLEGLELGFIQRAGGDQIAGTLFQLGESLHLFVGQRLDLFGVVLGPGPGQHLVQVGVDFRALGAEKSTLLEIGKAQIVEIVDRVLLVGKTGVGDGEQENHADQGSARHRHDLCGDAELAKPVR